MNKKILRGKWFITSKNDVFASSVDTNNSVGKIIDWHKKYKKQKED